MLSTIELLSPEVGLEVIEHLPYKDLEAFSVASRATRRLAFPLIFCDCNLLSWDRSSERTKLDWLVSVGSDVQKAIKFATFVAAAIHPGLTPLYRRILRVSAPVPEYANQNPKLLHVLENLPNVSKLKFDNHRIRGARLSHIAPALHAIRNAPIRHLSLKLGSKTIIDGPPLPGPTGLETCTIQWRLRDNRNPERAIDYLYTFIQPSLDNLYRLDILDYNNYNDRRRPSVASPILDFRALRPACNKMRRFTYRTISRDTGALTAFR